jgi:PAS domain S-box-containing protein
MREAMLKTFLATLPLIWTAGPAFAQSLPANAAMQALPAKSVLILHSGYDGDPWVQTWRQGFRRVVSAESGGVEIWTEYLGYPRVRWARYLDQLASHYSEKYRGQRFDLVITHGDRALEFVHAHRDLPFLDAPIVFSDVDSNVAARYANQPGFFGVTAPMDFRRTLDLALGLHPEVREIVFISPGFENRLQIEPLIVDYRPELPMAVWHDDYLSEIEARLTTLSERAVVVPLGVPLDSFDKPVDVRTFARRLSSVGEAPVYTVWDVLLGYGVVGGRMVNSRAHGESVAELALEVLAGKADRASADAITPARDTLDFAQLERFGIDASALPEDSVVVNQPARLLKVSRSVIAATVAVIAFLLAVVVVLLVNIVQRRAAQEALKASERRLNLALQVSRDGLWDWNLLTGECYFSPRWYESLDLDPSKVSQHISSWERLVHPQDLDGVKDAIGRNLRGETDIYESEHRVRAGTGEYRWHRSRGKVVEWTQDARPLRMVGVEIDITRGMEIQRALREKESQLEAIFEYSPAEIFLKDVEGRYTRISREFERRFNVRNEDLVGKFPEAAHYEQLAASSRAQDLEVLASGEPSLRETQAILAPDGQEHTLLTLKFPTYDQEGVLTGLGAVVTDITDRKLAEDELRESRKRLQLIADNVPGLLAQIDVDRHIRFINREAEKWFGLDAEAAVGKHIRDIIGDEAYETAQPYIDRALAGETTSFEMQRPYKYGPVRWVAGTFAPDFDEQGEVRGYYALLTDISERKRAQDDVKLAQIRLLEQQRHEQDSVRYELNRMRDELVRQTRLAAIGQVAASIAHDLRNPLGAIRNARFYLNRKLPKDQPKWQEYLDIMEHEIVVADTIIDDLVDMSRAKSPDKSDLDLEKALRDSFRRVNGTSNVEFDCVFDHRPFTVYADPSHLGRLLDNLILNAVQAMGARGRITVDATSEANFDTIRVKDEGPGVPGEIRSRIFEPLVTGKAKGSGLGLSICRQIAESHGGRIDLLRSGDAGAEFEVRLPRRIAVPMEVKRA